MFGYFRLLYLLLTVMEKKVGNVNTALPTVAAAFALHFVYIRWLLALLLGGRPARTLTELDSGVVAPAFLMWPVLSLDHKWFVQRCAGGDGWGSAWLLYI